MWHSSIDAETIILNWLRVSFWGEADINFDVWKIQEKDTNTFVYRFRGYVEIQFFNSTDKYKVSANGHTGLKGKIDRWQDSIVSVDPDRLNVDGCIDEGNGDDKHMKEVLAEGNFELRDDDTNKMQYINGKIKMTNIQNRDNWNYMHLRTLIY